jgi:probable rRNA maturation factor
MQNPAVLFHQEDISYALEHEDALKSWFDKTCVDEGQSLGEVNFIFCSDEYLHKMNVEYLQHDTYTDIITFDYSTEEEIAGDIFVSIDRVNENASQFEVQQIQELHRVLIHGILHLLGYKDKSTDDQRQMTEKEDFYLSLRTFL